MLGKSTSFGSVSTNYYAQFPPIQLELTAAYVNVSRFAGSVEWKQRFRMPEQQRVTAIVFVSRAKPDAALAPALEIRGIRLTWAISVAAATDALTSSPPGTVLFTEIALADGNWRDLVDR